MGDVGEAFKATKEIRKVESKQRKDRNYSSSVQMLIDNGIGFENKGYHLVIKHNNMTADF